MSGGCLALFSCHDFSGTTTDRWAHLHVRKVLLKLKPQDLHKQQSAAHYRLVARNFLVQVEECIVCFQSCHGIANLGPTKDASRRFWTQHKQLIQIGRNPLGIRVLAFGARIPTGPDQRRCQISQAELANRAE